MAIEKVKEYLKKWNLEDRVQEFDVSSATVDLAAQALGVKSERIAKTLALATKEGDIVIVTAGDVKIDNPKFKAYFHQKAKMLSPEETLRATGHAIGGVCPFALPPQTKVYLDVSLKRFETIFPACGSANSAIELTPDMLETCSGECEWIDVTKPKEI